MAAHDPVVGWAGRLADFQMTAAWLVTTWFELGGRHPLAKLDQRLVGWAWLSSCVGGC